MAGQISLYPSNPASITGAVTVVQPNGALLHVTVDGSALPTGAATAALQTTGNASLASIDTKLTAPLSVSQSGTWNINNISGTISLPTGAATETTLATRASEATLATRASESTLSAINTKLPAQGQALMAASQPVVIASNQSAVPISAASLPLPTGAATETTLSALNTKIPANLTVTSTRLLVDGSGVTQPVNVSQINGVATATGAGTSSTGTQRVVIASGATATTANVTSSATSVTILAGSTSRLGATIYNDSTASLYLKFGATASTTSFTVLIPPAGYYELPGPNIYNGILDGIWSAANGAARVTSW